MSDTYTKVFSSITESTVWGEPYATRVVWVTMLAMADAQGEVFGAVPGLARRANVTLEEVERALDAFLAPDPYSRTKEQDGRRIEEIDGGWRLINHAKYSAVRSAEERREAKRQWDRQNRPSGHARAKQSDESPKQSDGSPPKSDSPAPLDLDPVLEKQEQKSLVRQAARFPEFWAEYPVKKGRAEAEAKWKARGLDGIADRIIADVKARKAGDRQWLDGFAPHGSTYVNGRGWEDAIEPPKANGRGAAPGDIFAGAQ